MRFISVKKVIALSAFCFLTILWNASFSPARNNTGARCKKPCVADGINSSYVFKDGEGSCDGRVLVGTSKPLTKDEIGRIEGKGLIVTPILEPTIYLFESTNKKKTTKDILAEINFMLKGDVIEDVNNFKKTPDSVIRSSDLRSNELSSAPKFSLPPVRAPQFEIMDVTDPPRAWAPSLIRAPSVGLEGADKDVTVAIVDYGVDMCQKALCNRFWKLELNGKKFFEISIRGHKKTCPENTRGFNFWPVDDDDICNPDIHDDENEDHGTKVAGIIGADDKDVGVAKNVRLLPIRINNSRKTGCLADAIGAWGLIIKINNLLFSDSPEDKRKKIMIVNNSYGFAPGDLDGVGLEILETAVRRTREEGLLLIVSAGESGTNIETNPHYPASISSGNLIAVTATDPDDDLVTECHSNYSCDLVKIGAPGFNIRTTTVGFNSLTNFDCTSAAAPFISGGAAVIKSNCPELDYSGIKNALLEGADHSPGLDRYVEKGRRINIANAVSRCRGISIPLLSAYETGYFLPPESVIDLGKKPLIKKIS